MKDSLYLYRLAEKKGIPVIPFPLPATGSLCVQGEDGACAIGVDETLLETEPSRKVHLAHELGHCLRGAFYNRAAACDLRQKQENKADKWAIRKLIPQDELDDAVASGCTELWELAEHFDVTEDFMRKAVCLYVHHNLATELYF